tara:strand:- start:2407 stop:2667 length:261 start_codon:yes stop_codon:yes gene_type:complete
MKKKHLKQFVEGDVLVGNLQQRGTFSKSLTRFKIMVLQSDSLITKAYVLYQKELEFYSDLIFRKKDLSGKETIFQTANLRSFKKIN